MDVFMFPTHREAFGISLLEAMAAEVPIVASAVDGVPEVLDEGSGILLEVRTPSAFAHAAQRLLEAGAVLPAFDYTLKASHLFNLLDARGVVSPTERQSFIARVRDLAKGCAAAWEKSQ